jgi:nucleoside-diphosphate-sugar epimerase
VYTSTPSVLGYDRDVENGGIDLPHATRHESHYPESKSIAERIVIAANSEQIATVALRPHLVFGPADQLFLPRVISRARRGSLPQIGDGTNRVDLTYVDNAALAHLDGCDALTGPDAPCAGRAYFVSNDQPVLLWDWFGQLFDALDVPRPKRTVSRKAARVAGAVMEVAHTLLPLRGEPRLTRFLVNGLARSHWYDMEPARRDLGYSVRVSMAEGFDRTVQGLRRANRT